MSSAQKVDVKTKNKIKRMMLIASDLYQGNSFNITRLTVLKGLCENPQAAANFVTFLAQKSYQVLLNDDSQWTSPEKQEKYLELGMQALKEMKSYIKQPTEEKRVSLQNLKMEIKQQQSEYKKQRWGDVRIIESSEALVIENALECITFPQQSSYWGYHAGREYVERYNPRYGSGLIPDSAPMMEDVANYWCHYFNCC